MPLGYGYVERNADSYVDWREIGQYATDMLDETARVRQEKKDALDKATRDALKQIADTPVGAHASARQSALKMADVVSKNLLIQEKLMKSGRLDPRDYLIYNQNALDGIDLAFNANKAYQENYQKIIDGVNSEEMSGLTLENAAIVEAYGDWSTNGYMMSPEGNLMVGIETEQEIDGKKVKKLDKITSPTALNGLLLNTIPHNKLEDKINKWVPTLGKNQIAAIQKAGYGKQGMVITKEDITKRTDLSADEKTILFQFVEAEKLKVASLLGTPTNIASILFDTKRTTDSGIDYSPTDDAAEAAKDPSKILRVYDQKSGTYEFQVSDKQKAEAEKFAFNRMREKYDIIEKVDVGSQLSYPPSRIYGGDKGDGGGKDKKNKPEIDQTPSTIIGKTIGGVKIQDNSKAFPIVNLTLGDSPSEKDVNATSLIVSPGGKIYLEITKPNYIKTEFTEGEDGEPIKSTKPLTSILDFGKDSKEIGRFARRLGMTTTQLQDYAIQLAGDEFITTPDERRLQTTTGRSGKKIVKPQ
jgi:hypothetical protein